MTLSGCLETDAPVAPSYVAFEMGESCDRYARDAAVVADEALISSRLSSMCSLLSCSQLLWLCSCLDPLFLLRNGTGGRAFPDRLRVLPRLNTLRELEPDRLTFYLIVLRLICLRENLPGGIM